jgi:hypothetical protein
MIDQMVLPALSERDFWELSQIATLTTDATLQALIRLVRSLSTHPISELAADNPNLSGLKSKIDTVQSAQDAALSDLGNYLASIGAVDGGRVDFEELKRYCQALLRAEIARRKIS